MKDAGGHADGVSVLDRVTNQRFDVRAKAVVFCGGPYTDALRKLGDEKAEDAVAGASGTHVVFPAAWKSTSELGFSYGGNVASMAWGA